MSETNSNGNQRKFSHQSLYQEHTCRIQYGELTVRYRQLVTTVEIHRNSIYEFYALIEGQYRDADVAERIAMRDSFCQHVERMHALTDEAIRNLANPDFTGNQDTLDKITLVIDCMEAKLLPLVEISGISRLLFVGPTEYMRENQKFCADHINLLRNLFRMVCKFEGTACNKIFPQEDEINIVEKRAAIELARERLESYIERAETAMASSNFAVERATLSEWTIEAECIVVHFIRDAVNWALAYACVAADPNTSAQKQASLQTTMPEMVHGMPKILH